MENMENAEAKSIHGMASCQSHLDACPWTSANVASRGQTDSETTTASHSLALTILTGS
jgi:hypothetical protein